MTEVTENQVLVVLTSSPANEIELIDWLLSREDELGFTSSAVHGHSTSYQHLSIAEQVLGRQRRHQIQVVLEHARLGDFLDSLRAQLGDIDLHYWVVPVLEGGRLSRNRD